MNSEINFNLEIAKQILSDLKEKYLDYTSRVHSHALVEFSVSPVFFITILVNDGKLHIKTIYLGEAYGTPTERTTIDISDPNCFDILDSKIEQYLNEYRRKPFLRQIGGLAQLESHECS